MRKTSRYRALHLEGKCRALPGRTKGGCHKSPFVPPTSARQWYRKKLSFQQKIKRVSQPGWRVSLWLGVGGGVGGGLLFSPRSWWASRRRQQRRSQELTAQLGAGAGRPRGRMRQLLPLVTDREPAAAPPPRQQALPGSPRVPGQPSLPWERDDVRARGLGPPRRASGAEPPGGIRRPVCGAHLPAWLTCLPGLRPASHLKLPVSVSTASKTAPHPASACPPPTPPALLRKPLLRKLPGQGLPEAGLLGLQGSGEHVCFQEWR